MNSSPFALGGESKGNEPNRQRAGLMGQLTILPYIFDLEMSGKCNTACSFCPRDEMKRGEKYMNEETFNHFFDRFSRYAALLQNREVYLVQEKARAPIGEGTQSPLRIILCGMGESLMNPKCPEWVAKIRGEIGVRVSVVTNGLLLKEKMAAKLQAADITVVLVSMPGIDKASYDKYMTIDFDRVMANIEHAHSVMPGRVHINATIPDDAEYSDDDVIRFWEGKGIPLAGINRCHNRGGFLADATLTGKHGASNNTFCGIIARHNFIAWDGRVLSCCHDLHAENVLGHVSTDEFLDIALAKTPLVSKGPSYRICRNCNDIERCHAGQIIAVPKEETDLVQLRG